MHYILIKWAGLTIDLDLIITTAVYRDLLHDFNSNSAEVVAICRGVFSSNVS